MELPITLECKECGYDLTVLETGMNPTRGCVLVIVEPCNRCIGHAVQEIKDKLIEDLEQ